MYIQNPWLVKAFSWWAALRKLRVNLSPTPKWLPSHSPIICERTEIILGLWVHYQNLHFRLRHFTMFLTPDIYQTLLLVLLQMKVTSVKFPAHQIKQSRTWRRVKSGYSKGCWLKKKKDDESEGKQEESTEPRNQAGKTHVKYKMPLLLSGTERKLETWPNIPSWAFPFSEICGTCKCTTAHRPILSHCLAPCTHRMHRLLYASSRGMFCLHNRKKNVTFTLELIDLLHWIWAPLLLQMLPRQMWLLLQLLKMNEGKKAEVKKMIH